MKKNVTSTLKINKRYENEDFDNCYRCYLFCFF